MLDCASLQNVVNKKCHIFPSVNEKKKTMKPATEQSYQLDAMMHLK